MIGTHGEEHGGEVAALAGRPSWLFVGANAGYRSPEHLQLPAHVASGSP